MALRIDMYKDIIANYLQVEPDKIFFYWKGRVALYALLKAIDLGYKDEIIIPGFTCIVVPNAIKYVNAIPIYVDIEKSSLNTTLEKIKKKVNNNTKVIILQNTFGLSANIDEIVSFARLNGIYTIEDCAHGFGGTFKGKPNGTFADASFFSTQWNKPFSTGLGGFLVINNKALLPKVIEFEKQVKNPNIKDKIGLAILLFLRNKIVKSSTFWKLRRLYRFLSKHNLVIGSSSYEELDSFKMPRNYLKKMAKLQYDYGVKSIKSLTDDIKIRKKNGVIYTEYLKSKGKYYVDEKFHQNHSFLKYPVLVKNRLFFEKEAEKNKIELGDWFISPLHPVREGFEKWDLDVKSVPTAYEISKHIINLPTNLKNCEKVISFIEKNIDQIM